MQLSHLRVATLLLPLTACAGFPFFFRSAGEANVPADPAAVARPPSRALVEMQNPKFDGETLTGRILVGVEGGVLAIERRLLENASVQVRSVKDCATGQRVEFLLEDSFPTPASGEEVLTLSPGEWYGANVRFPLFDEAFIAKPPPACIEAEIWLRAADGQVVGQLAAQAEWSSQRRAFKAGDGTGARARAQTQDAGYAPLPTPEVDVRP